MGCTALYLRLSVDDDNGDESNSIKNQRDLLSAYVAANPELSSGDVLTFQDDGWSGTDFDRPQVTALLELARRGGVSCIVVKDLSRWGRNYPEVSEYLDQIFPFLGVRFISLGDNYDSAEHKGRTAPLDVAFGTILGEVYCAELSFKVRQSYFSKLQNGEFLCGAAPFGFLKSKTDRNRLVIDEDAAGTVRAIFAMACSGLPTAQIAARLNACRADTPLMYRKRKGLALRGIRFAAGDNIYWTGDTVRKILADERYTGVMVGGKVRAASPGSGKRIYLPKSRWIRVPDSHEAIVPEEVFKTANAGIRHCKKASPSRKHSPLAGKLKCGHCGKALKYVASAKPYYYCGGARLGGGMGCFAGRAYLDGIKAAVLAAVKLEAYKTPDSRLRHERQDRAAIGNDTAELKALALLTASLERRGAALFEDFADGRLDKASYLAAKAANGTEVQTALARADELTRPPAPAAAGGEADGPLIRRILSASDITDEVSALIGRVTVFGGNRAEILFAFRDTNVRP